MDCCIILSGTLRNTGTFTPRYFLKVTPKLPPIDPMCCVPWPRQAGKGQRYSVRHWNNPDWSNPVAVGFHECTATYSSSKSNLTSFAKSRMMDGLSGAASLIAVIDISAKIASLCFQEGHRPPSREGSDLETSWEGPSSY